jgi:alpha-mannosidase
MDAARRSLPAEMLPPLITWGAIDFTIGSPNNATLARGQTIALPNDARRVHLLMAADGDQTAAFRIGDVAQNVNVQHWSGFIGQWDTRLWERREQTLPPRPDAPPNAPPRVNRGLAFAGLTPGFIKPAPVAWFASHRHDASGANESYDYSYLFAYTFDIPRGATTLTLPDNDKIRIFAITASYDTLRR